MIWAILFVGCCVLLSFDGYWVGSGLPSYLPEPRKLNQRINRGIMVAGLIFLVLAVVEAA